MTTVTCPSAETRKRIETAWQEQLSFTHWTGTPKRESLASVALMAQKLIATDRDEPFKLQTLHVAVDKVYRRPDNEQVTLTDAEFDVLADAATAFREAKEIVKGMNDSRANSLLIAAAKSLPNRPMTLPQKDDLVAWLEEAEKSAPKFRL